MTEYEVQTEQWFATLAQAQAALPWCQDQIGGFVMRTIFPFKISDRFANRGYYVVTGHFVLALKQSQTQIRDLVNSAWTTGNSPLRQALPGSWVKTSDNRWSDGIGPDEDIQMIVKA